VSIRVEGRVEHRGSTAHTDLLPVPFGELLAYLDAESGSIVRQREEFRMNGKVVAAGLVLVGFLWVYLAIESYGRDKLGISLVQTAAALAFVGRGIWEWRKLSR
jgi:hypothetical protein